MSPETRHGRCPRGDGLLGEGDAELQPQRMFESVTPASTPSSLRLEPNSKQFHKFGASRSRTSSSKTVFMFSNILV